MTEPNSTPPLLPSAPDAFFRAGPDLDLLNQPSDTPPVLERLGPAPFPKGKFPFLGFLATVYDHVATHARNRSQSTPPPSAQ